MPIYPNLNITPEARAKALAKAKEARTRRKEFLDSVRDGTKDAPEALDEAIADDCLRGIRTRTFLLAAHGVGPAKAKRIMEECGIKEGRKLGGLGRNQVESLKATLAKTEPEESE